MKVSKLIETHVVFSGWGGIVFVDFEEVFHIDLLPITSLPAQYTYVSISFVFLQVFRICQVNRVEWR